MAKISTIAFGLTAILAATFGGLVLAEDAAIVIDTPMTPPAWALLERELLRANSEACIRFADKYVDERGYLLHTPRWGTLDGPDDAIETFNNWTLLHALGGSDEVLKIYKKAQEGHWRQYSELRTVKTDLAKNGAYSREFITQSDWFHTGEGMRAFLLLGLSDPEDPLYRERSKRFAGLYMNEDPEAPNYDAEHKVIKSIWTGSKGPMMHKATTYDWVGDAVPGRFHLLHNAAQRHEMLDLEKWYPRMLAHCQEYLDSVGDNPLNLAETILQLNAFMLTGDEKYRNWVIEYVNAWKERAAKSGGNIPSNVGLDGTPGGEYNGQWWKGTYGWNFTVYDGELEQTVHRNYFTAGSWPGFGNAYLMTGDRSYIDVLRRQMDNLYAQKKIIDGKEQIPQMYGDPRGYKFNEKAEWYQWSPNLHTDHLAEIYLWSMDRKDLERVPKTGWIGYLEGNDAEYPVKALEQDFEYIRAHMEAMRNDPTSPDTRLADWLLGIVPATTDTLTNLTIGGYFSSGRIWTLHSRVRYFDPARRRSGLPEDVAALVEKLSADSMTLTLVNVNPSEPRDVIIQAGGYGEHQFKGVSYNGKQGAVDSPLLTVRLNPGTGARLEIQMARYANWPTFAQPWNRAWLWK